jgi:hypothetical protein
MTAINLKNEIDADIKRYASMLEQFKSGTSKVGEVDNNGHLTDDTPSMIAHLEDIIRELRALSGAMK